MRYRVLMVAAAVSLAWGVAPRAQQVTPGGSGVTLLDAVRTALDRHPLILLQQREVEISRAQKQQASGAFDSVWTAGLSQSSVGLPLTTLQQEQARQAGLLLTRNRTTSVEYGGGLTRRLRNGLTLEPSATVSRVADRFDTPGGLEQSAISFNVSVPLMRGRGRDIVTAGERAADLGVQAALLDSNQAAAERIADVVAAYWDAVAAKKLLALTGDAEDRARRLADETRRLVEAGRVPPAEMNQVLANLASRSAEQISAEQDLLEARQRLGLAMGLSATDARALPELTDDLPQPELRDAEAVAALNGESLAREALRRRADYLAAAERVRAAETRTIEARAAIRPQLDLRIGGGYSALQEGLQMRRLFTTLFYLPSGPNVSVGLLYSFAPARNQARGRLTEAEAVAQEAVLRRDDLARAITASVVTAAAAVQRAAGALDKARQAAGYYREALAGEREKLTLGRSSLGDLLTLEDRLTTVLQAESRAQLRRAVAIAQLRFSSGTLIDANEQRHAVTREVLTTAPGR